MSITKLPFELLENLLLYISKEDLFNILEVLRIHGTEDLWKKLCNINGYEASQNECWRSTYQKNLNWRDSNFLKIPGTRFTRLLIASDLGHNAAEMDIHYKKSYIYLAYSCGTILRVSRPMCNGQIVSKGVDNLLEINASGFSHGVAVDWINDKLYWNNIYKVVLVMADLDGSNQQTIIPNFDIKKLPADLLPMASIHDVHVDPHEKLLFMIVGTKKCVALRGPLRGRVIKTDLSGQNPRALELITHDGKEVLVRTIAIDVNKKRIYGSGRLVENIIFYSSDYSGRDVDMIFIPNNDWAFPISLSSNYIYFTIKNRKADKVFKIDVDSLKTKNVNMQQVLIPSRIRDILDIKVLDNANQCLRQESSMQIKECSNEDCNNCKNGESICKIILNH